MSADESLRLLTRILRGEAASFALLCRAEHGRPPMVDVVIGPVSHPASLAELPLATAAEAGRPRQELLVLVPYRQLHERGFECRDDQAKLIALRCDEHELLALPELLSRLPDARTSLNNKRFDISDDEYGRIVQRVIAEEIGAGEGSNFVIKRQLVGELGDYSLDQAFAVFGRLLQKELGAYWIFLVHCGGQTFLGATPERHLSLRKGRALMTPISGTYRYPKTGPTLEGLNAFLGDRKESDELYMVLDEELKMMARICRSGGQVTGPYLREMTRLAHTEYLIEGQTDKDVRELLRQTMFAPTVTGSPIESATRVIARHEPTGRGYYSGIAALIGRDAEGERTLDSAILIRTAEIDAHGQVRIGVGSTLVRHSDPASEALETHAKVAALSSAFESADAVVPLGQHPSVRAALSRRNEGIAEFWFRPHQARHSKLPSLIGRRALIVDAEDHFTSMIAQQLASLGLLTDIQGVREGMALDDFDVIVMGPGPGDPRAVQDARIARLHALSRRLLSERKPFVAVCLSHQILALCMGLPLLRRPVPNQGIQVDIDLFGQRERVGFYNTYAARAQAGEFVVDGVGEVQVSRDLHSGEVHAMRGPFFSSMQFHAESVLTADGPRLLAQAASHALLDQRWAARTA